MAKVRVLYFASLRDGAQKDGETLVAQGRLLDLYQLLQQQYAWTWPWQQLRVAVNGEFADWQDSLVDGDEVVFIPPVSGG